MPNVRIDGVLFEREAGHWVGQFLQYDLGAQAETLPELLYQMQLALVGYAVICAANGQPPFCDIGPAPDEYWDMWRRAAVAVESEPEPPSFRVPQGLVLPEARMKVAAAT